MILYINTTDNETTELALVSESKIMRKIIRATAEDLSQALNSFLKSQKSDVKKLTAVAIQLGSGYFSRIRSSVVAANGLAYALNIPIKSVPVNSKIDFATLNALRNQKQAKPSYTSAPNITIKKKS